MVSIYSIATLLLFLFFTLPALLPKVLPWEITELLGKVLQVDGSGVKYQNELKTFREQDHQRYIYCLSRILSCVDLGNGIRELAGLLLRNELKDMADLIEPCLMDYIKTNSLAIISSPTDRVPRSTCQVISELARIAAPNGSKQWTGLYELIKHSLHNEQLLTPAVLETLGYLSLVRWPMWGSGLRTDIFSILVSGMKLKNNDSACLAATKAMCYASSMMETFPLDEEIILEAIVEAVGSSNLNIKQAAYECLIPLLSRFYYNLSNNPSHMKKIMEFTAVAIKEGKRDDAFLAIQFWTALCEVEIEMLKDSCGIYDLTWCDLIKRMAEDVIPLLLSLSCMEEIKKDDEFDRSLCLCLCYIAQAVEKFEFFTDPVKLFIANRSTDGPKYLVKVINSIMGFVSDILGEEEEVGKEKNLANEMERGEVSQETQNKKELGLWKQRLFSRMVGILGVLLDQDCEFLHKTMTETMSTYAGPHSISDPTAFMSHVCTSYFESCAFSYLKETHGENLLETFRKSWGTHLSMIQLLRLFFSNYGCHSKYLETWVLLLAFPKITDAVREVIDLASNEYKQMDKIILASVTEIFMAHGSRRAYVSNSNGASDRCAESTAMYCEILFSKGLRDEEIAEQLNMVSVVSKLYIDINCFIDFYTKRLGRRLHTVDWSQEHKMRTMVRSILFGGEEEYSSSLDDFEYRVEKIVAGQIADNLKFREYVVNKPIQDDGMVMNLATVGNHWSFKDASFENIELPPELLNMVGVVTKFLLDTPREGERRKFVEMIHSLSSCTIACKFGTESIELDMSTAQAALVLLFDTADTWSFSDILTKLSISHEELVSLFHSLSQENSKLLIKVPSTKEILPTDCFELNTNFTFTSPIPQPVLEDNKRKNVGVDNDMSCTIECVLMKVMKHFGLMDREELAGEAIEKCAELENCGFVLTRAVVDVRIASLINRGHLLVDQNDPNKLKWIAE